MKQRLTILGLQLGIFFALSYGYEHYIAVIFGYEGYLYQPDETSAYAAVAALTILSLMTPIAFTQPSTLFYQLILTMVLAPMLVLFHAENRPWEFMAQAIAAYCLALVLPRFVSIAPPQLVRLAPHKLRHVLLLIAAAYIGTVLLMGGGQYLNFDFSKVYDFREEAAANLPGLFGYLSPLVGKVVVPIAFVLSLLHKRYLMALFSMGFAVLIFGLTTHKSVLFEPLLILFIYAAALRQSLALKFNLVILGVILAALADFWMMQHHDGQLYGWAGALMMKRVFFTPAHLNYLYYDFFSRNEWVLFSNSKLSLGLLDYAYPLEVAHLIGYEYYDNEKTGANTGWFGSGYMQAGFAGMVLYAIVISLVFRYIDACAARSGNKALVTASVVVPVLVLVSAADLPTAFLTHGLYLNLLLIACFQQKEPHHAHRSSDQRSQTP